MVSLTIVTFSCVLWVAYCIRTSHIGNDTQKLVFTIASLFLLYLITIS